MSKRQKQVLFAMVALVAAYGLLSVVRFGCSWHHRDLTEYSLDEKSFDSEAMAKIEQESGIDLPDDAKGLAFHHIPPIDPIVFAKIKIPATSQDLIRTQIEALSDDTQFSKDFANERCQWWPATPKNVTITKQTFNNGYYVELYLVKEKDEVILFIKYFTI